MKLTDICEFQGGSQPPKSEWSSEYKDGYIRMLQIRDFTQEERVTPEYVKISNRLRFCAEDDILIGRYGASVGKILSGKSGAYNVAIMKTVPDTSVVRKQYMRYYFLSPNFQNYVLNLGGRAAQAGFSKDDLTRLEIAIVSLEEQDKIVNELSTIEKTISIKQNQLKAFNDLAKSRFIEMFGDPVENPKGWDKRSLLDMGTCKNGLNYRPGETGVSVHCLGVGDFKDLSVIEDVSTLSTIELAKLPSEECMLKDGDIVFVRSNGNKALVGRCLVVFPHTAKAVHSGFCIRYRRSCNDLDTTYLLSVLKSDSMRVKMAGHGANIQNLNQKILASLDIPIPPLSLQNEFAEFVKLTDKSKFVCQFSPSIFYEIFLRFRHPP